MIVGFCKDCRNLEPNKYAPKPAVGICSASGQQYGVTLAWAEMGNQFISLYVGPLYGCIHFEAKETQ